MALSADELFAALEEIPRVRRLHGLLLGVPHRLKPGDFDADGFCIAPGYARNDPVCSGKAMAALIAEVRADKYPPGSILVFIHTGGTLATYADPVGMLGSGT